MNIVVPVVFFCLSAALTGVVRELALRWRLISDPSPNRFAVTPTPIWGGVAVCLAFLSSVFLKELTADRDIVILLCASTGAFALGFLDDLLELPPYWKLAGQIVISGAVLTFGQPILLTGLKSLDIFLSLLWLVGITNAFNLLDNINGLAAGTAVLAASFQAALFFALGKHAEALACLAFAASVMGFLVFNFPTGRIFMGDSGSHFIGFWLAAMTLIGTYSSVHSHPGALLLPIMLMVVPICDTTLVTVTRRVRRQPISIGGTDHLSHRLLAYGFSERGAVIALWCLSLLGGLVALLTLIYGAPHFISVIALLLISVGVLGVYLTRFEMIPRPLTPRPTSDSRSRLPVWLGMCVGFLFDGILILAAYYTAYLVRFDGDGRPADLHLLVSSMPELVLIKLAVFVALGSYRCWWNYFGLKDALRIGWASILGSLCSIAYFSVVYRFYGFSRIVFVLDFLVFTLLALVFRFSFRLFDTFAPANHKTNVVIYGVDDEGELTLHFVTKRLPVRVIGFLDGDTSRKSLLIHSVPVLGNLTELEKSAGEWNVQAVVLTRSTTPAIQTDIELLCQRLGIGVFRMYFELQNLQQLPHTSTRQAVPHDTDAILVQAAPDAKPRVLVAGIDPLTAIGKPRP